MNASREDPMLQQVHQNKPWSTPYPYRVAGGIDHQKNKAKAKDDFLGGFKNHNGSPSSKRSTSETPLKNRSLSCGSTIFIWIRKPSTFLGSTAYSEAKYLPSPKR